MKLILCYMAFIMLFTYSISGIYIKDENIVLLRSQYKRSSDSISINGVLAEDDWNKAGIVSISFNINNISTNVIIRFFNDDNFLYFGITIDNSNGGINDSIGLYFDVDTDGQLTTPEDAKILAYENGIFTAEDNYWDGNSWKTDGVGSTSDGEFQAGSSYNTGMLVYEIGIGLISTNFQYDGFQIPSPTNSFVAFTLKITKRITANESQILYYPTTENNSTGYVDLKLAGPEDQDLPEYIPPIIETVSYTTIEYEANTAAQVAKDVTESLDATFYIIPAIGVLLLLNLLKKRGRSR